MPVSKRFLTVLLLIVSFFLSASLSAQMPPKREFRGTWLHTVGQAKYAAMNQAQMKAYFIKLLDNLQKSGINTVLFQVRPEADAWYQSDLEPWSRYITGEQGKDPGWDPLAFMVSECHKRNMDLHAWLNPYRVRTSSGKLLAPNHIYYQHPDWFIQYGDLTWFDPGNPECRAFIKKVVRDIVKRYDIDAIHMDDYFYPYPVAGKAFNDDKTFARYCMEMGFRNEQKAEWRRENVNILIRDLHAVVHQCKPWVEFGVSPFGIWRNKRTDPQGSLTNGLSNYDDLYADVLTWVKNGWIDYNIPQLYWNIGHKSADYATLLNWWADNNLGKPLYIGQDILRTIKEDSLKRNQLQKKMSLIAKNPKITGNCFWPAYELENNAGGICDSLKNTYHHYYALHPADNPFDLVPPHPAHHLTWENTAKGRTLSWSAPLWKLETDKASYYVIYRFRKTADINLDDPRNIVSVTKETSYNLPSWITGRNVYVVTAVDRCHNESKGEIAEMN